MTEPTERITALETNMQYVLGVLAKQEDYQASVLVKLTQIEMKQDQSLLYQKTCDAERAAHAKRLGDVENAADTSGTVWGTLLRVGSGVGGLLALAVSAAALLRHP